VRGISQQGRSATGVRTMNVRDDDRVSAVALVVESEGATAASVVEDLAGGPVDISADAGSSVPPEASPPESGGDAVDDGSSDADGT
jgi:DNA gyrase subunit A